MLEIAQETTNYVNDVRRAQVTPLYDTYVLATAGNTGSKVSLFGNTASSAGIHKTNMKRAYELVFPEKFTMQALRVVPIGCDEADLVKFFKNMTVRFILGGTVELEAPAEYWAGGAGLSGFAATTAADTTIKQVSNGVPDPRAIALLSPHAIHIEHGDHFQVDFEGVSWAATADVFIRVYLDGQYEKGVK